MLEITADAAVRQVARVSSTSHGSSSISSTAGSPSLPAVPGSMVPSRSAVQCAGRRHRSLTVSSSTPAHRYAPYYPAGGVFPAPDAAADQDHETQPHNTSRPSFNSTCSGEFSSSAISCADEAATDLRNRSVAAIHVVRSPRRTGSGPSSHALWSAGQKADQRGVELGGMRDVDAVRAAADQDQFAAGQRLVGALA